MKTKLFKVVVARGSEIGSDEPPTTRGKVGTALAAVAVAMTGCGVNGVAPCRLGSCVQPPTDGGTAIIDLGGASDGGVAIQYDLGFPAPDASTLPDLAGCAGDAMCEDASTMDRDK